MLRLGDTLAHKIEMMAEVKQVPYAVFCRMLIAERISEIEAAGAHNQRVKQNAQQSL